ncbi:hypothetical protein BASA50_009481 [Batrachochytrium salamandrivorans]|uniref:5-demethoxyubiquinone hydroxylase, mitochondrial n=1 Tax=Batrachochytrium salamandrivorans TaxID=1357716 RepID=A0ABQ8F132_9FUNG|nr:hypothetical protein BASA62_009025 [Batrachochytrium salamandrivorans]KAH6564450.1 hypothetical protein BASA60_010319 [Batrachochytrium salamandrivorans]KAH6590219.1 hypothetical protein BASA50_009481 [Batrachochytrium salamandrivorans]KAH6602555.1 hypothetical protein BASA61_001012 [Batrachochytrium salamandrivorans]KAH9275152.1 hypothetical protein BASA83_002376 [Batrachochytrium salamandrivorans]
MSWIRSLGTTTALGGQSILGTAKTIRYYHATLTLCNEAAALQPTPRNRLTKEQKERVDALLRVDQAGEVGANYIYMGQVAVLGRDPELRRVIEHMWEQEKTHLRVFDSILAENRVRPSVLRPLWEVAGFVVGAGTALIGKEAAMACTEAVETVIGEHYNNQIRELVQLEPDVEIAKLTEVIKQFRDDELEHLETALDYDAKKAPVYPLLTSAIKTGCGAAIWVASKF